MIAIAQGLTLTNYCGFIDSFITANPAYPKVVDQRQPGRVAPFGDGTKRSGSARSSGELLKPP